MEWLFNDKTKKSPLAEVLLNEAKKVWFEKIIQFPGNKCGNFTISSDSKPKFSLITTFLCDLYLKADFFLVSYKK